MKQSAGLGKDYLTVGEISKMSGLHKWTVSRTLDLFMQPFVEMIIPVELEQIGLKIKLVKLKDPKTTEQQVLRGLKVKL